MGDVEIRHLVQRTQEDYDKKKLGKGGKKQPGYTYMDYLFRVQHPSRIGDVNEKTDEEVMNCAPGDLDILRSKRGSWHNTWCLKPNSHKTRWKILTNDGSEKIVSGKNKDDVPCPGGEGILLESRFHVFIYFIISFICNNSSANSRLICKNY